MSGEHASRGAREPAGSEPPPFLRSWRNVYLLVLAELAALVIAFAVLREWAS